MNIDYQPLTPALFTELAEKAKKCAMDFVDQNTFDENNPPVEVLRRLAEAARSYRDFGVMVDDGDLNERYAKAQERIKAVRVRALERWADELEAKERAL